MKYNVPVDCYDMGSLKIIILPGINMPFPGVASGDSRKSTLLRATVIGLFPENTRFGFGTSNVPIRAELRNNGGNNDGTSSNHPPVDDGPVEVCGFVRIQTHPNNATNALIDIFFSAFTMFGSTENDNTHIQRIAFDNSFYTHKIGATTTFFLID